MLDAQPNICPGVRHTQIRLDIGTQTDHQISARRPDLILINKKKRTIKIVNFAVPANHRVKLKIMMKISTLLGN